MAYAAQLGANPVANFSREYAWSTTFPDFSDRVSVAAVGKGTIRSCVEYFTLEGCQELSSLARYPGILLDPESPQMLHLRDKSIDCKSGSTSAWFRIANV
jgi:hypothetical protein